MSPTPKGCECIQLYTLACLNIQYVTSLTPSRSYLSVKLLVDIRQRLNKMFGFCCRHVRRINAVRSQQALKHRPSETPLLVLRRHNHTNTAPTVLIRKKIITWPKFLITKYSTNNGTRLTGQEQSELISTIPLNCSKHCCGIKRLCSK